MSAKLAAGGFIMRKFYVAAMFMLLISAVAFAQKGTPQEIESALPKWRAAVEKVDVDALDVTYKLGKLLQVSKDKCLLDLKGVGQSLANLQVHDELLENISLDQSLSNAEHCIDTLSDYLALVLAMTDASSNASAKTIDQLAKAIEELQGASLDAILIVGAFHSRVLARAALADINSSKCGSFPLCQPKK